jgi:electron transfer flavoprotein alpha subunit
MAAVILVVTEQINGQFRKASFEVISEARRIADKNSGKVAALVVGSGIDNLASIPAKYGADVVLIADHEKLSSYNPDLYVEIVTKAVGSQGAEIILIPESAVGGDLAPRMAARLEAGLVSDCLSLNVDGEKFEAEHPMYAGKTIARISIHSKVKVATLRPNIFKVVNPNDSKSASVEKLPVPDIAPKTSRKTFRADEGSKLDLTEAEIIVTGGRGMKGPEHFNLLEDLAKALDGVVGATRAVVDAGWRPQTDQVGQTGKTVSPNLYMMFGASGAIQHWAGMSGAKCIVAVNKDPNAPIVSKADYSIVGDLFEIVPVLTEEIRKIRG